MFNVVFLKIAVFANYAIFFSLLFANNFVVNVMSAKTFSSAPWSIANKFIIQFLYISTLDIAHFSGYCIVLQKA